MQRKDEETTQIFLQKEQGTGDKKFEWATNNHNKPSRIYFQCKTRITDISVQ